MWGLVETLLNIAEFFVNVLEERSMNDQQFVSWRNFDLFAFVVIDCRSHSII